LKTLQKGKPNLSQTVLKEIGLKNVLKVVALTRIYKYESKHLRPIFVIRKKCLSRLAEVLRPQKESGFVNRKSANPKKGVGLQSENVQIVTFAEGPIN
jgi:hypothetical protein